MGASAQSGYRMKPMGYSQSESNPYSNQLSNQAATIANTGMAGPLSPQGTGNQKGPTQSEMDNPSSGYNYRNNIPSITSNPTSLFGGSSLPLTQRTNPRMFGSGGSGRLPTGGVFKI